MRPRDRTVALVDRPAPERQGPREVLVRTIEVGICGTDREICAFEYGEPPAGESELILGHEALGEVSEVGPDVQWVRPGDLVVPTVRRACTDNHCSACRQGHMDFCTTGAFTERGIVGAHGFLAEAFIEDEQHLVRVPSAIRDVAVLTEPLSIIAKAMEGYLAVRGRLKYEPPGWRGLVLGAGPIGLLGAMTLQAYGIDTDLFSREPQSDPRAELTRAVGASYISAEEVPLDRIAETTGKYDVLFEAVGVPQVAFGALATLAPNGIYLMTGIPARRGPVEADLSGWMRDIVLNNQVILGTVSASRTNYEFAIRALEQFMTLFPDAVRSLLRRTAIETAPEVLERGRGIKDVVSFSPD